LGFLWANRSPDRTALISLWSAMILLLRVVSAFSPTDPLFAAQFGLRNTGVNGSSPNEDINIVPAWSNFTGSRTTVGIVGNGCVLTHPDFASQVPQLHYNLDNDGTNIAPSPGDPSPLRTTGLAGLAIGLSNEQCTVGAAFNASFYCLKLTNYTDSGVSRALSIWAANTTLKYFAMPPRCSPLCPSGAAADGGEAVAVVPAGVDGVIGGDTNMFFRGPQFLTIADSTAAGGKSFWSNRGANLIANAPAGGATYVSAIASQSPASPTAGDRGCRSDLEPQGAVAALAAGVVSLMLQANRNLTWRDVQCILAITSTMNDPFHRSWSATAQASISQPFTASAALTPTSQQEPP
jgi:hypothetical protein